MDDSAVGAADMAVLTHGAITLRSEVAANNAVFTADVELDGRTVRAAYKPIRGERPLWDFPDGTLAGREVASFLLSEAIGAATGVHIVPPTVLRDGPLGPGMLQRWVVGEPTALVDVMAAAVVPEGWRPVMAGTDRRGREVVLVHADDERLALVAAFDAVINNADRKGGHLLDYNGGVFGIDQALTFHREPKLRTVLWGWADAALPEQATIAVRAIAGQLGGPLATELAQHLSPAEITACVTRVDQLLETGRYPLPSGQWPALPWPLF